MTPPLTAGERFVTSPAYLRALRLGGGAAMARALLDAGDIPVFSNAEARAALNLRSFSNLYSFSIDEKAYQGELPTPTNLPSMVETVETTKDQVELGAETSESVLATAVAAAQPLPEGQITAVGPPNLTTLPRFGVALPVALSVLDDPGQMASFLNRRMTGGFLLGLENDILNGNDFWPGAISAAGQTQAKGGAYRVAAIVTAAGIVQEAGYYEHPVQTVVSGTTKAAILNELSATSGDPILAHEMLRDFAPPPPAKLFVPSKFVLPGLAVVGDWFSSVTLITKGDMTINVSHLYRDFMTRDMAMLAIEMRLYCWVRQAGGLVKVTGIT